MIKLFIPLLLFSSTLFAFEIEGTCEFQNDYYALCYVCNNDYDEPIDCQAIGQGSTYYGNEVAGFEKGILYPGECHQLIMSPRDAGMDPLISASARGYCKFP